MQPMHAEILSTGDEVLTGTVVDSNAAYIAGKLFETGFKVFRHTSVGDEMEQLRGVLAEIGGRADIVIVTGGLGPTVDDLTAAAAALAAGIELAEHPTARSYVEAFFEKFYRPMTESDAKQALLPTGSEPIFNPTGTAPGFRMKIGGCTCFFLPGVPFEMRRMMTESVLPFLEEHVLPKTGRQHYREKLLSLFGLPEAEVNGRLIEISKGFGDVKLGMIARFPIIDVKLTAFGDDVNRLEEQLETAAGQVMDILGDWIFSVEQEPMEAVVGKLLRERGATVALAESCTGGLIAHRLTNVSGSSDYFLFSAVTYANAAKMDLLHVLPETLEQEGAVSEQTARQMAEGARRVSGADYALATSGIAGPTGGTEEKPVGTVCIGLAGPERTHTKRIVFPFRNRMANKEIFAFAALDMLRRELLKR